MTGLPIEELDELASRKEKLEARLDLVGHVPCTRARVALMSSYGQERLLIDPKNDSVSRAMECDFGKIRDCCVFRILTRRRSTALGEQI